MAIQLQILLATCSVHIVLKEHTWGYYMVTCLETLTEISQMLGIHHGSLLVLVSYKVSTSLLPVSMRLLYMFVINLAWLKLSFLFVIQPFLWSKSTYHDP